MVPRIYRSPYPTPSVPVHQSVHQFLLGCDPDDTPEDKVILRDFGQGQQRSITYGGLRKDAARDAAILQSQYHLKPRDVVCIYAYNSCDWAQLAHGVVWAGACFCGVNPLATSFELVHYFNVAKPSVVAVEQSLLHNVAAAVEELEVPPLIVVLNASSGFETRTHQHHRYPQDFLRESTSPVPPPDFTSLDNRRQPAGMCFSSGTSGNPKGVVFSHHNLIAQILCLRATNPFTHNGHMREVFFPSFAHVYGAVSAVMLPALVGSYVEAMAQYDFHKYLTRCSEIKATVLRMVPSAVVRMVKDPEARKLNLDSVGTVMCSGASLSGDTVAELKKMLNRPDVAVLNGYGMSEGTITLLREVRREKGASVGRLAAGVSARVVDDNFCDVPPGQEGECVVKGPTVFMGYHNNPTGTKDAFRDGWLCSGDVVKVDEAGFFYLTGRKKELIKFRGNQIAPAELDAVLLLHDMVVDAGTCGMYSKQMDTELAVGFVTLSPEVSSHDREKTLQEIKEFVNTRVAPYKRFRNKLVAMDQLPRNGNGKLLRRVLTQEAEKLGEELKMSKAKL